MPAHGFEVYIESGTVGQTMGRKNLQRSVDMAGMVVLTRSARQGQW